jgi:hypothetical protein
MVRQSPAKRHTGIVHGARLAGRGRWPAKPPSAGFDSLVRLYSLQSAVSNRRSLSRIMGTMTETGLDAARSPMALSYLAGLLEGEGSFQKPCPSKRGPAVALEMTDRDVVQLAADLLEVQVFPNRARQVGYKDSFVCRLRGGSAADLMQTLSTRLGERRNEQISRALANWQPTRQRRWLATEIAEMVRLRAAGQTPSLIAAHYGVQSKRVSDLLSGIAHGNQGQNVTSLAAAAVKADRRINLVASDDEDRAWLAGLLEGEAHFGCGQRHTVRVALSMTDQDVVERAAAMVGAKVFLIPPRQVNWMPAWIFALYGQRALDIAVDLEPLLGQRRHEQIDQMRQYYRPPKRFVAPPSRVARNIEIARRHSEGESGPALAVEFSMTHQNVYYITKRYRDQVG